MNTIEQLSAAYADQKVKERNEYPQYDMHRQKTLTRFDGYDIEQAHEDGMKDAVKGLWREACQGQPKVGRLFLNMSGPEGGISIRTRDEKHILAEGNRWMYIEDLLLEEWNKETIIKLTKWFNEKK